jgi:hypothetical protein
MIPAGYGAHQPHVLVQMAPQKKHFIVPCIGVLLIFFSLFMPYISVLGIEITGFDAIGFFFEGLSEGNGFDLGGGDGDGDVPLLGIAIFMLAFGAIFYSFMAVISTFTMLFESHPMGAGILHLMYFGIFMLCSILSIVDLGFLGSYSVHGDLTGFGFFIGGFAGILLCIKA